MDGRGDDRGRIALFEKREPLLLEPARRGRIEHGGAAERRLPSQDDAVAARRDDGSLEPQLRRALADTGDPGCDSRGAVMHGHAGAVVDRGQLLELDVEPVGDRERARRDERVASVQLAPLDPGQASATR